MAIVQWKLRGFSQNDRMEREPQDDYKRLNESEALQVITGVATVRILREPANFELWQVPRHRLHQACIYLLQHTLAQSKVTLLVQLGLKWKNTSFKILKLLTEAFCYDVVPILYLLKDQGR